MTNLPVKVRAPLASSTSERTSGTPESVALSSLKMAPVRLARSLARVVFPHLGESLVTMRKLDRGVKRRYIPRRSPENEGSC